MSTIIELQHVDKVYENKGIFGRKSSVRILKDITFSMEEGETLGLVGESGSGKTTATRILLRQEKPTRGDVFYYGKNIKEFSKAEDAKYRRNVQTVFQDPFSSLDPTMRIADIIAEPLVIRKKYSKEEIQRKTSDIMKAVGLSEEYLKRYPREFSGGQRQRIAIARALIDSPKLLILDEPVSALDVSVRGQIMNLLKDLQKIYHTTYLFISHDMASVGFISTKIAVMYFGYIVEYADADTILNQHLHPYTDMLIQSDGMKELNLEADVEIIDPPSHLDPPKGCPYASRCKYATELCREEMPGFRQIKEGHYLACHNV